MNSIDNTGTPSAFGSNHHRDKVVIIIITIINNKYDRTHQPFLN